MRTFITIITIMLSSGVFMASCDSEVYGDDSDIVLPPKPEVNITVVTGAWLLTNMQPDVETGNTTFDELLKQGIMNNPLLQTIQGFKPTFTFDIQNEVSISAQGATFPGGTYTYKDSVLNYTMVLQGLSAYGIPDIGPVLLPIKVYVSKDNQNLNGVLDIRFLIKDQLTQAGIPEDKIKANLNITLQRAE